MKRNFYWERMEVKRHGEKEAGECIKEGRFLHAGPGGGRGDERAEGTTGESRARRSRPARMNREAHYWVITTIPSPRLIPADHGRNPELPLFTCNCLQHNPHLRITRFSPFMKGCSSQEGYLDFEPPPHFLHSCIPETHMKLISATLPRKLVPDRDMWKVLIIDDFLMLMRSRTEKLEPTKQCGKEATIFALLLILEEKLLNMMFLMGFI
ncbi:PREDICTED: uncharacterized protein LOC105590223 isoform X2 [Cercocebus atys]|uniref:uncharacterized protein LOC105590223 isoform X2 n=1 Tax=Cercocebus atys TaxID=9531 RepID=UPI0005F4CDC1|nr:PREDICTED: uncharacterized protein LOC105590223 isoform X2 [Cercocebus atys]